MSLKLAMVVTAASLVVAAANRFVTGPSMGQTIAHGTIAIGVAAVTPTNFWWYLPYAWACQHPYIAAVLALAGIAAYAGAYIFVALHRTVADHRITELLAKFDCHTAEIAGLRALHDLQAVEIKGLRTKQEAQFAEVVASAAMKPVNKASARRAPRSRPVVKN